MSFIGNNILAGASGNQGFEIARSLRFNSGDSAHLTRTPSSASNSTTFTWSAWIKVDTSTGTQMLFSATSSGSLQYDFVLASNQLNVYGIETVFVYDKKPSRVFRDPSAWYHLVVAFDTTDSTPEDRIKIYVNGERETDFATNTNPSASRTTGFNKTVEHSIGGRTGYSTGQYFNGYQTEINFIDGSQLGPENFGETDSDTGAWIPKKYSGTYGTNGFYLNFSDNSNNTATTLGKDSSGNGNNFTPSTTISVTAGTGNDSMEDTPTNNFCTMNALAKGTDATLSNGNLDVAYGSASTRTATIATMGMSSGRWYWEHKVTSSSTSQIFGITNVSDASSVTNYPGYSSNGWGIYGNDGDTYHNSSTANYGSGFGLNDVLGCAFDADNGKIWWSKNGTFFNSGDPAAGTNAAFSSLASGTYFPAVGDGGATGTYTVSMNFGQNGGFTYTPPTGFKALNTANLPEPTVKNGTEYMRTVLYTGNATARDISVTDNLGNTWSPDWVWIKGRTTTSSHTLYDAVRGATKRLSTHNNNDEDTDTDTLTAFNSNGFSLGADVKVNTNNYTYASWNWDAGDSSGKTFTVKVVSDSGNKYRFDDFGTSAVTLDLEEGSTYVFDQSDSSNSGHPLRFSTTSDGTHNSGSEYTTGVTTTGTPGSAGAKTTIVVAASAPTLYYYCSSHSGMGGQANTNSTAGASNFAGSIQSTVRANVDAGFSIGKFSGTGAVGSIGHGLGISPKWILIKNIDSNNSWAVYHDDVGANKQLLLNGTSSAVNDTDGFPSAPTSTVINVGSGSAMDTNQSGSHLFLAFAEVEGYSKIGTYTGNGLASDGPFIYLGFRPAWVMFRGSSIASNWCILDSAREPSNLVDAVLLANTGGDEKTNLSDCDFLSNGIKIRDKVTNDTNISGHTFTFIAFAEMPFKYANAR